MRLFVAIDLPDAVRRHLAMLGGGIPGARWVPAENLHLTLRFIGEVDGATADDVAEALATVRADPFETVVCGVGHFETGRRPHALWAGVTAGPALRRLHAGVDMALQRIGLAPEGRKYVPHVTLARLKGVVPARVQGFLTAHADLRSEPFPVAGFTLYSSFLGRGGALYRAEAGYDFTVPDEPEAHDGADLWDPWAGSAR
ncbi:MAG: RNA 2',3'-cyclic phosphodiesterase [Alphaproteobacteria bacterium]